MPKGILFGLVYGLSLSCLQKNALARIRNGSAGFTTFYRTML